MTIQCRCGAVGEIPTPHAACRQRKARGPVIAWRGGNIDPRWLVIEELSPAVSCCPACQHRACVYVVAASDAHGADARCR